MEEYRRWLQCQAAPSGCPLLLSSQSSQSCPPPLLLLLLLPSCCPSSGVWPRLPAYLRSCLVFLLSSLPLLRLFSSWSVVFLALSGHSLPSCRPLGVFVLLSYAGPILFWQSYPRMTWTLAVGDWRGFPNKFAFNNLSNLNTYHFLP